MKVERLVFTWVSTGRGGAEESTMLLAETIRQRCALEVVVLQWVYGAGAHSVAGVSKSEGLDYYACSSHGQYVTLLEKTLQDSPSNSVLFSNYRSFILDLGISKRHGKECIIIFRGLASPRVTLQTIPRDECWLRSVPGTEFDWATLASANAVVAVSDCSAASVRSMIRGPSRVHRVYNGVRDQWLNHNPASTIAPTPVRRFLMVSRLVDWKRIVVGVEAFIQIAPEFPDTTLDIVGEGPERSHLLSLVNKSGVSHRIHFQGWQQEMQRWYRQADCLIHCAPYEAFGRVLAEANACGLAAVAPRSGAGVELIEEGVTGLTFEPDCVAACHDALHTMCTLTPAQRLAMSIQAFQRARERFSASATADQYVALAEKALQQLSQTSVV